jgi:hypothetical protein
LSYGASVLKFGNATFYDSLFDKVVPSLANQIQQRKTIRIAEQLGMLVKIVPACLAN